MPSTIFFSWQSDTPNRVGRNFLERALTAALAQLAEDGELEEAARDIELDRDTKNVAGSPPIVDTIFDKIDAASAIVCDVTFVSERADGKKSPNPNVLIEYGWALKSRTHNRVITVMNIAYGAPSEVSLPFDMRHLRWPITYELPADVQVDQKSAELKRLTKVLIEALRPVLATPAEPVAPKLFPRRPSGSTPGRWEGADHNLGLIGFSTTQVEAPKGPLMWFRMRPQFDQGRTWSSREIRDAMWGKHIARPFTAPTGGFDDFRGDGLVGSFTRRADPKEIVGYWASVLFESGELWGIDGLRMEAWQGQIGFDPELWKPAIDEFWTILSGLGVTGPIAWEAGFEGCLGRKFGAGRGPSVKDLITIEGIWDDRGAEGVSTAIFDTLVGATS